MFAAAHQVRVRTLRSWLYRLRREREDGARILPVRIREDEAVATRGDGGFVELLIPCGVRLRFSVGTEPAYVADLVARLG
jgi:hypothetical protein